MSDNKTPWRRLIPNEYLGSYDLDPNNDLVATISKVTKETVTSADGSKTDCVVLYFKEPNIKKMVANRTNCKTITKLFKTAYIEEWQNRSVQIYVEKVRAFGEVVEALRIRPFVPKVTVPASKAKEIICADCGCVIQPYGKLTPAQVAQNTQDRFGKTLCIECGKKAAVDKTEQEKAATDTTAALQDALNEAESATVTE